MNAKQAELRVVRWSMVLAWGIIIAAAAMFGDTWQERVAAAGLVVFAILAALVYAAADVAADHHSRADP